MVSFYPGPSRVYDEIPQWMKGAHRKGILSMNHRSEAFMTLSKKTIELLKEKLDIPEPYSVFFLSSATECWEVIAQSLVKNKSVHLFNGAFGEKWFEYTHRLKSGATAIRFDPAKEMESTHPELRDAEVICITQNETSNGTQVSNKIIGAIRQNYPEQLIAVDATSSMAGVYLNFSQADIWFASVQKCFGLPAGLALMVCSPAALSSVTDLGEKNHYNSLTFMTTMMEKWQTPFTPNVAGIYLLMRVLKKVKPIAKVHTKISERSKAWWKFFEGSRHLTLYASEPYVRSDTVITIKADAARIESLKKKAVKKGLLLGEGYGDLKKSTFRIANFPALKNKEIQKLRTFLKAFR